MAQYVFQRKEQKFMLDSAQCDALQALLDDRLQRSVYGKSAVCNVYFDTPDHRLIRRSVEKPVYKEKLRIRSYGTVGENDRVFLEMKKKYKGIVYKRRVELQEAEAFSYMADPAAPLNGGQIGNELDYFKQFYRELQPAVYLSYDRLAWFDPAGSDLRVTVDYNVRYRTDSLRLSAPMGGTPLLEEGKYLLEVKSSAAIPMWLTEFLSSRKIYKISFSKYGMVYTGMLQKQLQEKRGLQHAR